MKQNSFTESDFPTGLAKPAQRALASAGYLSLEQLSTVSEADIINLHGMGPNAVAKLKQALAEKGLTFTSEQYKQSTMIQRGE